MDPELQEVLNDFRKTLEVMLRIDRSHGWGNEELLIKRLVKLEKLEAKLNATENVWR